MGVQIFNIVMDLSGDILVHIFEYKIANWDQLFNAGWTFFLRFLKMRDIKDYENLKTSF